MQTRLGHHVVSCPLAILQWFTLGGAVACGNGESPQSLVFVDAAPDAGARPVLFVVPPAVVAMVPPPERDARAADVTVDSPAEAAAPECVPEGGVDEPDEAFADTDCDGIDGDSRHAVFVATTGSDSGTGTTADPFRTLAKAVAAASGSDKSVYVCNGEYAENIRVERGLRIYGGYDCAHGWRRIPDRALVAPVSGTPLVIVEVADPVIIDRLSFRAPDADPALHGSSSIAASAVRSKDVVFRHSVLRGGDGIAGADGAAADALFPSRPPAQGGDSPGPRSCIGTLDGQPLQGSPSACFVVYKGGKGARGLCTDGFVEGGTGGKGGNIALGVDPEHGWGGTPGSLFAQIVKGTDGAPGAASLLGFGRIELGTYFPSNSGDPGKNGKPGSAGVGGAGGPSLGRGDLVVTFGVGGGGGAGGLPGCGGPAGKSGGGGGGSFALISDDSRVRIESSLLEAGRGGDGGAGAEGAPGQIGGEGGPGGTGTHAPDTSGKDGQRGGDGGHGGAGGPGGGGPSVGIAWTKVPPSVDAVNFVLGTPGRGGVSSARIGVQGIVAEIHPPAPAGDAGEGGIP